MFSDLGVDKIKGNGETPAYHNWEKVETDIQLTPAQLPGVQRVQLVYLGSILVEVEDPYENNDAKNQH